MILLLIIGAIVIFVSLIFIEADAEYRNQVTRMDKQRQDIADTKERIKNKPVYKKYVPKD